MNRFRALDIARGVAILGTLGTNIWIFTQTMEMTWLSALSSALTNGKFLGLLTLMFGIGMQLKHDSLQRRGLPWRRIYIWSMILLFLDGLLHYVFVFEFDVLMSYALVGIIASFLMTRPKKVIVPILLLSLAIHGFSQFGPTPWSSVVDERPLTAEEERAMSERFDDAWLEDDGTIDWSEVEYEWDVASTYTGQVKDRLSNIWEGRQEAIMILPMNLALFLTGALLVQAGLIGTDRRARTLQRRVLSFGLVVGIPLLLLSEWQADRFPVLGMGSRYVIAPIVSFFYLGLVFLWERTNVCRALQTGFENIGKMALTCYIGQNVISSILFYKWGFGLAPLESDAQTVLAWACIGFTLMLLSTIWLRYFERGPIESLWKKAEALAYPKRPTT